MLVPVVSDQLGAWRRPDRDPSYSLILSARAGAAAAATTTDIERVSLARAVDRAPERDGGYDLLDHNGGDEPPEIHWQ